MERWGWNTGNATGNEDKDIKDWPYLLAFPGLWCCSLGWKCSVPIRGVGPCPGSCSFGSKVPRVHQDRGAPVRGLAPSGGRCPAVIWNV